MADVFLTVVLPVLGGGILYLCLLLIAAWIGGRFGYVPKGYEERFRSQKIFELSPEWYADAGRAVASAKEIVARAVSRTTHTNHLVPPAEVDAAHEALARVMAAPQVAIAGAFTTNRLVVQRRPLSLFGQRRPLYPIESSTTDGIMALARHVVVVERALAAAK